MNKKTGIEVSIAAAEAVGLANVDVVAAYPITPQTHIVEHLAELVGDGRLDAEYVAVESEHSALSACIGASAAGARTFTATASQGLLYMHEVLFMASSMRLPIVMAVANRAVSGPINIWADHSDVMPQRDTGWVQLFAQNGQEVFDMMLQAFKLAEDHRVLLPVMVNMDGFSLSHVIEPVSLMSQDQVDKFLPAMDPLRKLDPAQPRTMGPFGAQDVYTEVKMQQQQALCGTCSVMEEIWKQFATLTGRGYQPVESYRCKDAETILVTMGAISETAAMAVDEMREDGLAVGLASIRLWRPFPIEQLLAVLKSARTVAVIDRMLSPGVPIGPVGIEIRSAFYGQLSQPMIHDYVLGLGGREIKRKTFKEAVKRSLQCRDQKQNDILMDARWS
jgi:pyruvate ferredoxin oxidoreductase alpha subunit